MKRLESGVILVSLILSTAQIGCGESSGVHIRFVDPSRVALRDRDADVLPAGRGERTEKLAQGEIETEPGASAHYEVSAKRAADGELAFEWATKLPIVNGEHQILVRANGEIPDDGGGGDMYIPHSLYTLVTADTLKAPTLRLESCARLSSVSARGTRVGYHASEWQGCEGALAPAHFVIDSPWDNVAELRKHDGGESRTLLDTSLIMWGASAELGGVLLLDKGHWSERTTACTGGCAVGGVSLVGLGILMLGGAIWDLIANPPRDEVVYRPTR